MFSILSIAYPFAPVTPDPVGGAEQVLSHLDTALMKAGHRSTMIAAAGSRIAGHLHRIALDPGLIDDDARARTYKSLRGAMTHVLEREAVDLIHMHGIDFARYLPARRIPVLVTLHMPLKLYPDWALRAVRPGLWLVPVSRSQARTSPQLTLLPPIENGVEIPRQAQHARRRYALAMGRICPEKNFAAALDASRLAGFPLLLAGQAHAYREHQAYFETEIKPRLGERLRWIGPIAGARKQRLLAGARCVLVPSLIAETCSLVAMEALAAGTPVIAYRAGALPELIEHGRTGFIVDDIKTMAEAIRAVGEIDPEECRRAACERFALSRMTNAYLALYERLILR
jgi:glycosyltransferase involved in cell wall biosynthesis